MEDSQVESKKDLLSRYISKIRKEGRLFNLGKSYLRDVCTNFLLAGRDTTSQLLTWLFCELSRNPDKEEKLLREIDTLKGEMPDFESIKSLKYLKSVINETLRMHPPVPFDPKVAVEEDVLPSGFKVEKGWLVFYSPFTMGRNEKYWEKPDEFVPERWEEPNKFNGGKQINPSQFAVFQLGPRRCLGEKAALLEATIIIILISQKYKLRLKKGHPVQYLSGVTVLAKYGMLMTVEKRDLFY